MVKLTAVVLVWLMFGCASQAQFAADTQTKAAAPNKLITCTAKLRKGGTAMISSRACEVVAKDASIVLWAREYNGKAPIGFVRSQMRLVECFDRYIPSGVGKWSGQCTSVEATADVTTDGWLVVGYRRE